MQAMNYEPQPLDTITYTCRKVTHMARKNRCDVLFAFNGFCMTASPDTNATALENRYWQHLHAQAVMRTPEQIAALGKQDAPIS